jgi:hypothetical protein
MEELNHAVRVEPTDSSRQIDPEVEKAARHADMPDGLVYDTTDVEQTGAGNMPMLALVLTFVGILLFVFAFFAYEFLK